VWPSWEAGCNGTQPNFQLLWCVSNRTTFTDYMYAETPGDQEEEKNSSADESEQEQEGEPKAPKRGTLRFPMARAMTY
jgi:hypothetical protein